MPLSACRKSLFFSKKCLFSIPIPKPLSPGKGLNVGLPPSPCLGATPQTPFLKLCRFFDRLKGATFMPLSLYSVIIAFSGTTAVLFTRGSALIGSSLPYRVDSDLFAVVYARICFFFRQFSRLCCQFLFL